MSLLSPGVEVIERDADLRIETVTSSTGAVVVAATKRSGQYNSGCNKSI
jgi:hypothetical protein